MPEEADLSDEAIRKLLSEDVAQPSLGAPPFRPAPSKPEREAESRFANKVPGIPLDTQTGPPAMETMGASFRSHPEDTVRYWQDLYGKENVRLSTSGVPIVRAMNEETGQPEDILVDPEKMTVKDLTKIAGQLPAVAGAVLGDKYLTKLIPALKGTGILKSLAKTAGMTLGAEGGEVLRDAAIELGNDGIRSDVVDPLHWKRLVTDYASALALGAAGKVASKVISPFGGERPPIQQDLQKGLAGLRARYAEPSPDLTLGQVTGVPLFQRTEETMRKLPGGALNLRNLRDEFDQYVQRIQNRLVGLAPDADEAARAAQPTHEELGARAIATLQEGTEPTEKGLLTAQQKLLDTAHQEINDRIASATLPTRTLEKTTVGQTIRDTVTATRDKFESDSSALYNAAYMQPGGRDRILVPQGLAQKAKDMLKSLPPKTKIVEAIDYDTYGSPVLRTTKGQEVAREFVPSNVTGKLQELSTMGATEFSLQDLVSMRNEVTNDIKVGEAIPGVQTHHLGEIRKMLTSAIEDSTKAIPDKNLYNSWKTANDFYAANAPKFHTAGIASILKDAEAPGYVGNAEIVSRITGHTAKSTDLFLDMKKFLGENSVQYKMLTRSIADDMLLKGQIGADGTINMGKFTDALQEFRSKQPEVFRSVFGNVNGDKLIQAADDASFAGRAKIDPADLQRILANPGARAELRDLAYAQQQKDKLFKNSILKAVGSQTLPAEGINAGDFIERFAKSSNPTEVRQAMDLIDSKSPDLAQGIRFKTVQNVLDEAARSPKAQDTVTSMLDPSRPVNSFKLSAILSDPKRARTLTEILGKDTMDAMKELGQVVRPGEQQETAFASAGGIQTGFQISNLIKGKITSYIDSALRNTVGAAAITFPPLRAYLSNQAMTAERTAQLITAAVASRPIVEEMIKQYGRKGAEKAAASINAGMRRYVADNAITPDNISTNAVLQLLNQP